MIHAAPANPGEPVSLSTVRRVLAPVSCETDFRYDTTILPIANALGITFDAKEEPQTETEDKDMIQALTIIKENYGARIADLWKHINSLRRDRAVLGVVIILLIAFIAYLFADGLNGHWGIF